jgi:hypothetical protein
LYVANDADPTGNILKYDGNTGDFLGVFVDSGVGGMGRGNDLHWGPDGNLYVSLGPSNGEGKILRYDSTGTPLGVDGSTTDATFINVGPGLLCNGFGFAPDGNIYVAVDNYNAQTNHGVFRFNPDGTPNPADGQTGATFVLPGSGGVRFIDGIGFGNDGNLYVTDQYKGRILEYDINDNTGAFLGVFVDRGSGGLGTFPGTILFYDDGTGPSVAHHEQRAVSLSLLGPHAGQRFVEADMAMASLDGSGAAPEGVTVGLQSVKQDDVNLVHQRTLTLSDAETSLVPSAYDNDLRLPAQSHPDLVLSTSLLEDGI